MKMLSLPTEIIICFLQEERLSSAGAEDNHIIYVAAYHFLQHEPGDGPGAVLSCEDILAQR